MTGECGTVGRPLRRPSTERADELDHTGRASESAGSTDDRAPKGLAPIAIGLGLTVVNLVAIPVTNCSANPARSLGVAWFAGGAALAQVWLFFVAPIIGAAIAGATYALITGAPSADVGVAQNPEMEEQRQKTA